MEAGLVQRESKLRFLAIPAAALRGRNIRALARNLLTLLGGTRAAWRLIAREQPAVILGTGGYVCVPVFLAARMRGIPTIIYLPDVRPGLAVKLLARIADVVACSVKESVHYLGMAHGSRSGLPRFVTTGYPVRPELYQMEREVCRATFELRADLPMLLVTGGSRGARSINQAVAALLPDLLAICQIVHVCGREGDAAFLEQATNQLPAELRQRYQCFPYLHSGAEEQISMTNALGAADVVLCRSGASTLGELPALGLPAVLVPYPYVHQEENADYLVQHGAAVHIPDGAMLGTGKPSAGPLFRELQRLLREPDQRTSMARSSRTLAQPNAARQLAQLLLALASRRGAA